jgi:hypothetical protein
VRVFKRVLFSRPGGFGSKDSAGMELGYARVGGKEMGRDVGFVEVLICEGKGSRIGKEKQSITNQGGEIVNIVGRECFKAWGHEKNFEEEAMVRETFLVVGEGGC